MNIPTLLACAGGGVVMVSFLIWLVWSFSRVFANKDEKISALEAAQEVYEQAQQKILKRQSLLRDKLIESRDSVQDYLQTREVPETPNAQPLFQLDEPLAGDSPEGGTPEKRKRKRDLSRR